MRDEIYQHSILPSTPRASRSSTPKPPGAYDDDDGDIIDLATGKRETIPPKPRTSHNNGKAQPIAINETTSTSPHRRPHSRPPLTPPTTSSTLSSSYLTFPRKWTSLLSSSLPSAPQASPPLPRQVTREDSYGQFTPLPHVDLHVDQSPLESTASTRRSAGGGNVRPGLAGLFEDTPSQSVFAKKVFVPPSGAPGK